ncbi:hypothetical protein GCM10007359_20590 [Rothia aerolata]|uniref:Uncharacterized protein n=1 Tax=Rothia aerolata TaxID=1812262 RepID=A0A917IWW0_9MICC|nr:hypothetical protein GCM10007359_20590 [Rothia aerolata]
MAEAAAVTVLAVREGVAAARFSVIDCTYDPRFYDPADATKPADRARSGRAWDGTGRLRRSARFRCGKKL